MEVQDPARLRFKTADIKAAMKMRAEGNKREQAAAAVRAMAKKEHLSDADVAGLVADETGEVATGMFGGIGEKPIPGRKSKVKVFHVNGVPISPDRLMYIGYANTDEGQADEELRAKMIAEDKAQQQRVHVGSGPWEKNIERRVDLLNAAHGKMSPEARALLAELDTTDPRRDLEKQYCPHGMRVKWFVNGERIAQGYQVARTENGDPVTVRETVMAVIDEAVVAEVERHLTAKRKQKYDQHRSGAGHVNEKLRESAAKIGAEVIDYKAPKIGRDELGLYEEAAPEEDGSMVNLGDYIQDAEGNPNYQRDLDGTE